MILKQIFYLAGAAYLSLSTPFALAYAPMPNVPPLPPYMKAVAPIEPLKDVAPAEVAEIPLPTPSAPKPAYVAPAPVSSGSIQDIIIAAAGRWGVSPGQLLRVAACESGFNLYAHNPSGATGLFQFMPSTFYGYGGTDLYSAYDQANIAAKMFSQNQSNQWVCK